MHILIILILMISRLMKPSYLRVRSVCVSDHLSPTRARTLRIGQLMNNASLMSFWFCSFFSFIICLMG